MYPNLFIYTFSFFRLISSFLLVVIGIVAIIYFSIYLFIDIEDTAAIMVLPRLMTKGATDLLKICSVSIHISFYTHIYIYILTYSALVTCKTVLWQYFK